ncbi:MAG: hypothetical protein L0Y68_02060 [Candidatus Dadabacteria bacterium]|nr:hypothetical protein [Candidatus Dadabacteria bacterium]
MAQKRILIDGSNFSGFTATIELAKHLNRRHEIANVRRVFCSPYNFSLVEVVDLLVNVIHEWRLGKNGSKKTK